MAIFQFNDPNAKIMHMKGRKHRQQYKKKVDPELKVDVKPSNRQKQLSKLSGPYANDLLEGDMNGGRFVCTQFIFNLLFVKEIVPKPYTRPRLVYCFWNFREAVR